MMPDYRATLLLALALLTLSGCGQMGPLYIEKPAAAETAPVAEPAAPASPAEP